MADSTLIGIGTGLAAGAPGRGLPNAPTVPPVRLQASRPAGAAPSPGRTGTATPPRPAAESRPATINLDGRVLETTARRGTYLNIVI